MTSLNVEAYPTTPPKVCIKPEASTISCLSSVSTLFIESEEDKSYSSEYFNTFDTMATRFMDLLHPSVENSSTCVPLVVRCLRLLSSCRYDESDISSVLAVTVIHHNTLMSRLRTVLSDKERSFIIVSQIYIAHTIVLDECCVLSNWHKHLFSSYCDLHCLRRAVARILKRMDYTLFVHPDRVTDLANSILNFS